jgi:hypothetical protein
VIPDADVPPAPEPEPARDSRNDQSAAEAGVEVELQREAKALRHHSWRLRQDIRRLLSPQRDHGQRHYRAHR